MPELPEAETIARQLSARLLGATITECRIERADIVREGRSTLPWYLGARLVSASRLGKSVVLEAERSGETRYLAFELGMRPVAFDRETFRKGALHLPVDGAAYARIRYAVGTQRVGGQHLELRGVHLGVDDVVDQELLQARRVAILQSRVHAIRVGHQAQQLELLTFDLDDAVVHILAGVKQLVLEAVDE